MLYYSIKMGSFCLSCFRIKYVSNLHFVFQFFFLHFEIKYYFIIFILHESFFHLICSKVGVTTKVFINLYLANEFCCYLTTFLLFFFLILVLRDIELTAYNSSFYHLFPTMHCASCTWYNIHTYKLNDIPNMRIILLMSNMYRCRIVANSIQ